MSPLHLETTNEDKHVYGPDRTWSLRNWYEGRRGPFLQKKHHEPRQLVHVKLFLHFDWTTGNTQVTHRREKF